MTSTLISKIAAASLAVGALKTDKRNAQQNYEYISADKILERAGDALAKAGIVVVPSITSESTDAVETAKGGVRYDSVVHFGMILTDGESQLEMPWCGRGSDYSVPDKAMYKAITSGHKYFLMKLLNIGVGNEDGEHENFGAGATQQPATASNDTRGHNAANGPDVVFEQPAKPRATKAQLAELDAVGAQYYGAEWAQQRPKLCDAVSKGATTDAAELVESEITRLINGIRSKLAAHANGVAA